MCTHLNQHTFSKDIRLIKHMSVPLVGKGMVVRIRSDMKNNVRGDLPKKNDDNLTRSEKDSLNSQHQRV